MGSEALFLPHRPNRSHFCHTTSRFHEEWRVRPLTLLIKKEEPPPGKGAAPVFAPEGGIPLERSGRTCVLPGWPPTIGQGRRRPSPRGEGGAKTRSGFGTDRGPMFKSLCEIRKSVKPPKAQIEQDSPLARKSGFPGLYASFDAEDPGELVADEIASHVEGAPPVGAHEDQLGLLGLSHVLARV